MPQYHCDLFTAALKTNKQPVSRLAKEIEEFQKNTASVLLVLAAIADREAALAETRHLANSAWDLTENAAVVQLKLVEQLKKLRMKSLAVTEAVQYWHQPYKHSSLKDSWGTYLEKMQSDFLFVLELTDFVKLPAKPTTFFSYPCGTCKKPVGCCKHRHGSRFRAYSSKFTAAC